jgi:hypothetical protein
MPTSDTTSVHHDNEHRGLEGSLSPRRKAIHKYVQRRPTNLHFPIEPAKNDSPMTCEQ